MERLGKILIIRFSSIGDIVLASPLVRVLRSAEPDAIIDFAVKAEFADLVKFNPNLSSVIELRSSSFAELRGLRRRVRSERYSAILDLHNSLRSRYLRYASRARRVRVVNKRAIARFALVNLKRDRYRGVVHVADRYLETVAGFGMRDDGKGLELFVPEETAFSVKAILSKHRLDKHGAVVGLAPGARHFTKRWPAERFVACGVRIAKELKAKLLVVGGPEEKQYCGDIVHMINAEIGSDASVNLAGSLSLLETASALDHCDLVITNDSGLMHIAAARKRRIVAVFGPTVREFGFFPYGGPHTVLEPDKLDCRPCSPIGLARCPEGHFRCMKDTAPGDVFGAAVEALSAVQTS